MDIVLITSFEVGLILYKNDEIVQVIETWTSPSRVIVENYCGRIWNSVPWLYSLQSWFPTITVCHNGHTNLAGKPVHNEASALRSSVGFSRVFQAELWSMKRSSDSSKSCKMPAEIRIQCASGFICFVLDPVGHSAALPGQSSALMHIASQLGIAIKSYVKALFTLRGLERCFLLTNYPHKMLIKRQVLQENC